jgi:hypothetical protein
MNFCGIRFIKKMLATDVSPRMWVLLATPNFLFLQAIENVGFGRFQWFLMAACGAWWAADAMEVMVVSFLLPSLRHAWNLHGYNASNPGKQNLKRFC